MNNQPKTTIYKGVQRFDTEAAGHHIKKLAEKLPSWLLVIGLLFRFAFLSVIIPELQATFQASEMGAIPFFVITVGLSVLAEILFSLTSLANPSLFVSENTRFWGFVVLGFGGVGLIYNGLEMYWFVEDYMVKLAHPESESIKPHVFLQMCNILSWFATETAGFMLISEGRKVQHTETVLNRQEAALEATDATNSQPMPVYLEKCSGAKFYLVDWGTGEGVEQHEVSAINSNWSVAKSRAKDKAPDSAPARNFAKWDFLKNTLENAPEGLPVINTAGYSLNEMI